MIVVVVWGEGGMFVYVVVVWGVGVVVVMMVVNVDTFSVDFGSC